VLEERTLCTKTGAGGITAYNYVIVVGEESIGKGSARQRENYGRRSGVCDEHRVISSKSSTDIFSIKKCN